MSTNSSSLGAWLLAVKMTLDAEGIDSESIFKDQEIDSEALNSPEYRVPLEKSFEIWKYAVRQTENPAFGLNVSRHIRQTTFHALGYAVMASPSLKDAFERITRYFRVVADATELHFKQSNDTYCFIIEKRPCDHYVSDESIDAMMAVIYRSCFSLSSKQLIPIKVSLTRQLDKAYQAAFNKAFNSEVVFSNHENAMYFKAQDIEKKLPFSNEMLARHNDEILNQLVASYEKGEIHSKLEKILIETLCHGEPRQDDIAKTLGLSTRNLQRKLAEENTSYRDVLSNTRKQLADNYLKNPKYSISEVAYLLGFSNTSSFNRMLKEWTDMTPGEYRNTL